MEEEGKEEAKDEEEKMRGQERWKKRNTDCGPTQACLALAVFYGSQHIILH